VVRDENHPEYDVYLQVEGPTHYFINHQPNHAITIFNGATEYRNRLHESHSIHTSPISYFDIDERSYFSGLLEKLHIFPEGYSPISTAIEEAVSIPKEAQTQKSHAKTKRHKLKKKPKAENKVENGDDFYAILEEVEKVYKAQKIYELTYDQIEKKYRKNSKVISPQKLLEDAVKHKNTDEIEVILNHYKSINQDELNPLWSNAAIIALCEKTLNKISSSYKESKIYIEIYALFLKYNYLPELKENHLKALIYSYGYGDVEIFQNYLNLFPENSHQLQLMEYFMVNCGSLNHIQIANFLLLKNIDINSCYSRESAEVLYALAVGHKHNFKPLKDQTKVFSHLFKLMTEDLYISSDTPQLVENLFQLASGGNLDKGDGIPEGRGVTALHLASYSPKNNAVALFLLENNANPNTINKDGVTPLITALLIGNEKAALQILNFQPNVDLKAFYDLTAAHIAARYGFIEVIKRIGDLKGNFDIQIRIQGLFPVKNNIEKDIWFKENETPLWIALKEKHIELAKYLIEGKANLDSHMQSSHPLYIGSKKLTPEPVMNSILTYCIYYYPELVTTLLKNGAKVNDDRIIEPSALIRAAELSNPDTQSQDAKLFKEPKDSKVYDMSVAFSKHNIFEALLLCGADVNFKDIDGDTVSAYVSRPGIACNHHKMIAVIRLFEYLTGYNLQIRKATISTVDPSIQIDPAILEMQETKYSFSSYIPGFLKNIFLNTKDTTLMLENSDASSESLFIEIESSEQSYNIKSSKIDLNRISTSIKAADIVIDLARLVNRPNDEIAYKFIYDISYMASSLRGSGTPISLLLSSPHIATKIKQGDYAGAAVDASLNIGFPILSYTLSSFGFPVDNEFLSKVQTLLMAPQLYYNIELLYEEITDPDNAIKSTESYQNIKYAFSDLFYAMQDMIGLDKTENHEEI
jgi:ankyrin repeat protein